MKKEPQEKTERMELFLSYILLIGVSASAFFILLGIILVHIHPQPHYPGFIGVFKEGIRWNGYSLLVIGFLLLLATPILRVISSFVLFLIEEDWTYAIITFIVLLILAGSIFLGALKGKAFGP